MVRFLKTYFRDRVSNSTKIFYHRLRGQWAAFYFQYPAKKLKVVGVTGTNGKTTTCHLITAILEKAGKKVGMFTTTTISINGKREVNKLKMTTPDPYLLQKLIKEMVDQGCEYLVLETSSHALAQNRTYGIAFDVAVMTNLTREHLDYHQTYKEYEKAKLKLFKELYQQPRKSSTAKVAILNRDDRSYERFVKPKYDRVFSYGILRGDIMAVSPTYHEESSRFLIRTPIGEQMMGINLPGRFNIYNALAAVSASIALGVKLDIIIQALAEVKGVPGRMEVINQGQDFKVIVDYAHTPDGLNQVLQTLKPTLKGKLIVLVGAEGRRSKTKRPLLGALAGRYADIVIVTNVDPRDEEPMDIIDQVAEGVKRGTRSNQKKELDKELFKIPSRKQAIKKAFRIANSQDTVLLLAKGAEQTMELKDKIIPWDDREIARKLLKKKQN